MILTFFIECLRAQVKWLIFLCLPFTENIVFLFSQRFEHNYIIIIIIDQSISQTKLMFIIWHLFIWRYTQSKFYLCRINNMTQEILKNPCGSFLWWIKCNSMLGHNCIFIAFNKAKLKIQVETLKQKLKFCKVIYYIYKIKYTFSSHKASWWNTASISAFNSQGPIITSPNWLLHDSLKISMKNLVFYQDNTLKLISSSVFIACMQDNILESLI